jgi:hypothetical protein
MAAITQTVRPVVVQVPRWAWLALAVAFLALWAVAMEAGFLSEVAGRSNMFLHEAFHDGRHLLGVPCH